MTIKKARLRVGRDTVIFVVGLAGIIGEAARNGAERPTLLLLFAAMIGLPQFLQKDEKEREAKQNVELEPQRPSLPPDRRSEESG